MQNDNETSRIGSQAQDLLRSGSIGNALIAASGRVETPIPVQTPGGQLHSWFVPVTVGNHLAGFFQFLPEGTFMRFSSFQRRADDLAGCPAAADWLDLERIQERAAVHLQPDETSGKPFLTYDRTPDRLLWAVPLTNARGKLRLVYVAGQSVYVPPPDTGSESYG
jgi:hypothetical protein